MNHFWDKGALFVRELRELYPEPKPHFNTLSTQVRELETDGFLDHKAYGPTYQYFPIVSRDEYSRFSMGGFIGNYFGSYLNAVSAFVGDGKVSIDELANATGRNSRSVGANVTDLKKKGLAERVKEKGADDKDVTYVQLTDEGMAFVPAAE